MEINHFDENGKKIENNSTDVKQNTNNPTIIHHNRLDSLPVVRLGGNKEEENKVISSEKSSDTKLQTTVKKQKSKYEVDKDSNFKIEFGVMFDDTQVVIIPKEKFEDIDKIDSNIYEKHWVTFRMWNFLESVTWRQECMEFLQHYKIFNLNVNKFNELKVRRLLLDWSFKNYGDNHKLFHIHEQLTDESMNLFFKDFNPIIIQHIVGEMNRNLGD
jgi:hypothetical protein